MAALTTIKAKIAAGESLSEPVELGGQRTARFHVERALQLADDVERAREAALPGPDVPPENRFAGLVGEAKRAVVQHDDQCQRRARLDLGLEVGVDGSGSR